MSAGALALALGAALLHATWNVLLAGSKDTAAAAGGLIVWGLALLALPALLVGEVSTEAVPFIAASALLELGYFLLLVRAYRDGELSVVYPVARGVAPAIVLVVAVTAGLGEGVGVLGAVGVLLVVVGVLLVGGFVDFLSHSESNSSNPLRDVAFGLAIAAMIAGYTLVDSEGVDHASPVTYLALVIAPTAVLYPAIVGTRPDLGGRSMLTAAATLGAYLMVLAALTIAPAAPVAAVRESSIVFATLLAAVFLHERVSVVRMIGAATVLAGVAAIAYT